jgi:hypothetical protein
MSTPTPSRLGTLLAQAPDKLSALIADEEGYGIPGAIPTVNFNPGDLRHSPHSEHNPDAPDAIGKIDNAQDGWSDLEEQLQRYAARGLTLQQAIYEFAPPEQNNSAAYLKFVCDGLGCTPDTLVSQALQIT